MEQQIRFCTSADGTRIAYATYGEGGGTPLLLARDWAFGQEKSWEFPQMRALHEELAAGRVLVTYDLRGVGASQREIKDLTLEAQLADISAVVEHAQLKRFHLYAYNRVSAPYAAQQPERVSSLILSEPSLRGEDSLPLEALRTSIEAIRMNWSLARRAMATVVFPDGPTDLQRRWSDMVRESTSPEVAVMHLKFDATLDISEFLPRIEVPTLVLHFRGEKGTSASAARAVASLIPNARLLSLNLARTVWYNDPPTIASVIRQFMDEVERPSRPAGPVIQGGLVTILFTDITDSTALTQRLGDAKAQQLVRAHNAIVREALAVHDGTETKHTGDGIMASFPTASGALDCAIAVQRAVAERNDPNLQVHIGLNAGEPVVEEQDLFGTSIQLARRICDHAEAGQILVSNVVRELAAGKGFLFADRADVALRGFEEPVRLCEVRWQGS